MNSGDHFKTWAKACLWPAFFNEPQLIKSPGLQCSECYCFFPLSPTCIFHESCVLYLSRNTFTDLNTTTPSFWVTASFCVHPSNRKSHRSLYYALVWSQFGSLVHSSWHWLISRLMLCLHFHNVPEGGLRQVACRWCCWIIDQHWLICASIHGPNFHLCTGTSTDAPVMNTTSHATIHLHSKQTPKWSNSPQRVSSEISVPFHWCIRAHYCAQEFT